MKVRKAQLMMVLASAVFSTGSGPTFAYQSVEKIMADYYRAMGGLENLRAWKGMKGAGKYVLAAAGAPEIPFAVWYKAPDKQRIEMKIQGQTAVYASDGKNPWFCDPTRGVSEPAFLPEDQARDVRNHADEYPFIDYEKKGHRLELLGKDVFEGRDVFKVRLTRNNGSESFHYSDQESGLEARIAIPVNRGGNKAFKNPSPGIFAGSAG